MNVVISCTQLTTKVLHRLLHEKLSVFFSLGAPLFNNGAPANSIFIFYSCLKGKVRAPGEVGDVNGLPELVWCRRATRFINWHDPTLLSLRPCWFYKIVPQVTTDDEGRYEWVSEELATLKEVACPQRSLGLRRSEWYPFRPEIRKELEGNLKRLSAKRRIHVQLSKNMFLLRGIACMGHFPDTVGT